MKSLMNGLMEQELRGGGINKITTPCIKKCKLKDDICIGCKRTSEQIKNWSIYDENTRLRIIKGLK